MNNKLIILTDILAIWQTNVNKLSFQKNWISVLNALIIRCNTNKYGTIQLQIKMKTFEMITADSILNG